MPSTTETQGLVLAEALAAGACVIASDAPQNRDVLGGAGRLVPATAEAFASAFRELTAGAGFDPRDGTPRRSNFSIDRQIDGVQRLYASLMRPACIA